MCPIFIFLISLSLVFGCLPLSIIGILSPWSQGIQHGRKWNEISNFLLKIPYFWFQMFYAAYLFPAFLVISPAEGIVGGVKAQNGQFPYIVNLCFYTELCKLWAFCCIYQGGRCWGSAGAAFHERLGSSTKGRTPNIRYFVAKPSIVSIYAFFERLSQGFQRKTILIS